MEYNSQKTTPSDATFSVSISLKTKTISVESWFNDDDVNLYIITTTAAAATNKWTFTDLNNNSHFIQISATKVGDVVNQLKELIFATDTQLTDNDTIIGNVCSLNNKTISVTNWESIN